LRSTNVGSFFVGLSEISFIANKEDDFVEPFYVLAKFWLFSQFEKQDRFEIGLTITVRNTPYNFNHIRTQGVKGPYGRHNIEPSLQKKIQKMQ
jgi:hypothetical protein